MTTILTLLEMLERHYNMVAVPCIKNRN